MVIGLEYIIFMFGDLLYLLFVIGFGIGNDEIGKFFSLCWGKIFENLVSLGICDC